MKKQVLKNIQLSYKIMYKGPQRPLNTVVVCAQATSLVVVKKYLLPGHVEPISFVPIYSVSAIDKINI